VYIAILFQRLSTLVAVIVTWCKRLAREGGPREATPISFRLQSVVVAESGVFEQHLSSLYYWCSGYELAS